MLRARGVSAQQIVDLALRRGLTLAAAESLTGGLVSDAIVAIPGASRVFRGGIVAYTIEAKASLLGVPLDLIERSGVVSEDVACAMARGAVRVCDASIAVATTGAAGPEPHGGQKPGTVCVAVASATGVTSATHLIQGGREAVRVGATEQALALCATALSEPDSILL
ncbi:CinA family protein [Demequina sp. B12]|uniref:CinA family protein n=1 Tax=Demequina sp. B12 TaxID=2992757 RepID=UPI00237BA435|nr:CinA family protein [Demequina sp. B12]MDE0573363.1 CinA family protein [Demequina sp. B12]